MLWILIREVPQRGTSNEYPQHMFSWKNQEKIFTQYPLLSRPMTDCMIEQADLFNIALDKRSFLIDRFLVS